MLQSPPSTTKTSGPGWSSSQARELRQPCEREVRGALLTRRVSTGGEPSREEEPAVTSRTLKHTLYALLATLTTGRSLRLVQRVANRNGFERGNSWWRKTRQRPRVGDSRCCKPCYSRPGMGDDPAKFEEMWMSWEHEMDVHENLSAAKLDGEVKISVMLREAPPKLRDHLLVSPKQFESNYNKLRAIIQAYLNSNKTWIANDCRESDPMEVDHTSKGKSKGKSKSKSKGNSKGNGKGNSKGSSRGNNKGSSKAETEPKATARAKAKAKARAKATKSLTTTMSATYVCGKRGHFARDCWSRANNDKLVNEVKARPEESLCPRLKT